MASAAPPVRYPNVYGIDMPTSDRSWWPTTAASKQIRAIIGCDALIYQDVDAMKQPLARSTLRYPAVLTPPALTALYVTGDVGDADIARLNAARASVDGER
jgi:amidophosphoribosyltransferase